MNSFTFLCYIISMFLYKLKLLFIPIIMNGQKKLITSVVYLIPQVSACSLLLLRTKSMCLEKYEQSENKVFT